MQLAHVLLLINKITVVDIFKEKKIFKGLACQGKA